MNKLSAIAFALVLASPAALAHEVGQETDVQAPPTTQEAPPVEPAPPVSADVPATPAVPFATLDADQDGRISADEAKADEGVSGSFTTLDADDDGYVTEAEYRADAQPDMPAPGAQSDMQ